MGKKGAFDLVMPKNSGDFNLFCDAINIVGNSNGIMNTKDFVSDIGDGDITSMYHKSVMPRYFGLMVYDSTNKVFALTNLGFAFYSAATLSEKQQVIFDALLTMTFGKYNNAVSSNSSIEPPIVFLKTILLLGKADMAQLGCVMYLLSDKKMSLIDAINFVKTNPNISSLKEDIVALGGNKFFDLKFNKLFEDMKIVRKERGYYYLSNDILEKYSELITSLGEINIMDIITENFDSLCPEEGQFNIDISKEKWAEFFSQNHTMFKGYQFLKCIYDLGGEASLIDVAKELGKVVLSNYIGECVALGLAASKYFEIEPYESDGKKQFLSMFFYSKTVVAKGQNVILLILRRELREAIEEIEFHNEVKDIRKTNNELPVRFPNVSEEYCNVNRIVYGAPGTGKTYSMPKYAVAICDSSIDLSDRNAVMAAYKHLTAEGRVVFTTFHQNYGYEDFIQGLRPDAGSQNLSFKTVDGIFKRIADRAMSDFNNNYVIIIDEINRGNISKIFGELITLIEDDKRWGQENQMSATLPYPDENGDSVIFAVPNNLYIIGTMNSADKSISLIDAALRRRFIFVEQKPDPEKIANIALRDVFNKLNEHLASDLNSVDLLIGHSYFMHKDEKDLCNVMNNSIIPLLYEYYFDQKKKIKATIEGSIDTNKFEVLDDNMGRLSIKEKVGNDS